MEQSDRGWLPRITLYAAALIVMALTVVNVNQSIEIRRIAESILHEVTNVSTLVTTIIGSDCKERKVTTTQGETESLEEWFKRHEELEKQLIEKFGEKAE